MEKISYERRIYESVDDWSLSIKKGQTKHKKLLLLIYIYIIYIYIFMLSDLMAKYLNFIQCKKSVLFLLISLP